MRKGPIVVNGHAQQCCEQAQSLGAAAVRQDADIEFMGQFIDLAGDGIDCAAHGVMRQFQLLTFGKCVPYRNERLAEHGILALGQSRSGQFAATAAAPICARKG